MNSTQAAALERLQLIDWENCGYGKDLATIDAHWSAFVAATNSICEAHGLKKGIYQLCGAVLILSKNKPAKSPEELFHLVLRDRYRWRGRNYVLLALSSYLEWENLSDEQKTVIAGSSSASNPCLPLVMFFENGGAFTTEHGMVDRIWPKGA